MDRPSRIDLIAGLELSRLRSVILYQLWASLHGLKVQPPDTITPELRVSNLMYHSINLLITFLCTVGILEPEYKIFRVLTDVSDLCVHL